MMKYLLLILFMASFVLAACDPDQIDINAASLSELDKLDGIGEVKAQAIIDSRYFDSIDDLIDVYGIGEITLEKIKNQGLACVRGEEKKNNDLEKNIVKEIYIEPAEEKTEMIELIEEENEVLIYESKESVILKYLPYFLCLILLLIITYLMWQRF